MTKIPNSKLYELVKGQKPLFRSFRRKPESSDFSTFWMPVEDPVSSGDQVRHDELGTFYETIKLVWVTRSAGACAAC